MASTSSVERESERKRDRERETDRQKEKQIWIGGRQIHRDAQLL